MKVLLLIVALAVACGTNPTTIPVTVPGQPKLFTGKSGTGGWSSISGTYDANANATTYQVQITEDFELAAACQRDDATFVVSEVFGTVDDAPIALGAWDVPNCVLDANGLPPPGSTTKVSFTATFDTNGNIAVDTSAKALTAGVPRTISTWQGTHDVIASSDDNQVLVIHDVTIDSGTDLGTIAVTARAESLISATFSYTPAADEAVGTSSYLLTERGSFELWDEPDQMTALLVPPDQLGPGDIQQYELHVSGAQNTIRGAHSISFDGTISAFDLLPRLAGITARPGELGVTWTPFADYYTDALVYVAGGGSALYVSKSKLWLERHSTTTIDFDMDVDGYDPAWVIASPMVGLEVERWSQDITLYSELVLPTM